jgi:hypothetical protein
MRNMEKIASPGFAQKYKQQHCLEEAKSGILRMNIHVATYNTVHRKGI